MTREPVTESKGKKNETRHYWDCSCIESYAMNEPNFELTNDWRNNSEHNFTELRKSGEDGYCPVGCETQFYSLLGFMFIAGLIGSTTRLPNTIISLRTIDKRDKVASYVIILKHFGVIS